MKQLRRGVLEVVTSFAQADQDDQAYWWRQTIEARLEHIQLLRELNYGDQATVRLQRIFCVARTEQR